MSSRFRLNLCVQFKSFLLIKFLEVLRIIKYSILKYKNATLICNDIIHDRNFNLEILRCLKKRSGNRGDRD